MARPLRLEFLNALYHITSRGDHREDIYEDDEDRRMFLNIFGKVVTDFNGICHGYCLISNHYHLIVETLDGNISKGMRQLNGVYTQSSNRRHWSLHERGLEKLFDLTSLNPTLSFWRGLNSLIQVRWSTRYQTWP